MKPKIRNHFVFVLTLVLFIGAGILAAPCPAPAADQVTLRVADFYPPGHPIRKGFLEAWAAPLEKRTNGRVKIDYYGHESLVKAKDILDATINGVADIGNMTYAGSRVPLIFYQQLPGVYEDDQTVGAARAMWKIHKKYVTPEFEKLGLKLLYVNSTTGYQVMTTKQAIRKLSDVQGMKFRVAGSVLPHSVKALGGVPVSMTMGEVYEAMERGVVDGIALSVPSVKAYAFYEILKYATVNCNLGGYPSYFAMNMKTWNSLPDDIKKTIEDMALEATTNSTQIGVDQLNSDLNAWKQKGIEIIRLPKEDAAKAAEILAPVWGSWTKAMSEKGYPMKALVADWQKALAEEGIELSPVLVKAVQ
jgi:TRAP-type C4-dicarboxylate transport system substrate-binding protein